MVSQLELRVHMRLMALFRILKKARFQVILYNSASMARDVISRRASPTSLLTAIFSLFSSLISQLVECFRSSRTYI
mgnify:CR=1 FL=1